MASAIYLDYQATTQTDERVVASMLPYFTEVFGNPHATYHSFGSAAETAVQHARSKIANLIACMPDEIIFTSGATEANNMALRGLVHLLGETGRKHILASPIEHKCVLAVLAYLEEIGFRVTFLPVGTDGLVASSDVEAAIQPDTGLVTMMAANNEIGVVQPIEEIGAVCRKRDILFHTDAAQAVGKIPINVTRMGIDLLSMSGHKLYGPKGIGALYVRRRIRRHLQPLILGGAQERGLRSGTLPTPLCVGLGEACSIAQSEMEAEAERLRGLRTQLLRGLEATCGPLTVNGSMDKRLPGNLNLSFQDVDAEALVMALHQEVAISTGSACTSASIEPSHVLTALGLTDDRTESAIRIGLGRFSTADEVDSAVAIISAAVHRIRKVRRNATPIPFSR